MIVREDGKERLLTPVEHCRVKGIPENLVKGVFKTTAHEVIGQSILFNHCVGILMMVAEGIFKSISDPGIRPRPSRLQWR